jgi:hypothetical protein
MTHFLRDILRQPKELRRTIDFLFAEGRPPLDVAAAAIRGARLSDGNREQLARCIERRDFV